jgi:hypothetical protein
MRGPPLSPTGPARNPEAPSRVVDCFSGTTTRPRSVLTSERESRAARRIPRCASFAEGYRVSCPFAPAAGFDGLSPELAVQQPWCREPAGAPSLPWLPDMRDPHSESAGLLATIPKAPDLATSEAHGIVVGRCRGRSASPPCLSPPPGTRSRAARDRSADPLYGHTREGPGVITWPAPPWISPI